MVLPADEAMVALDCVDVSANMSAAIGLVLDYKSTE